MQQAMSTQSTTRPVVRQVLISALNQPLNVRPLVRGNLYDIALEIGLLAQSPENRRPHEIERRQHLEIRMCERGMRTGSTFSLFEPCRPVTAFTIQECLETDGWIVADARAVLMFGRCFQPGQVDWHRVMSLGSRFDDRYMFLYPSGDSWRIGFERLEIFRQHPRSAILAWRPNDALT